MIPQVSVILPYYEGREWVLRAVQSVQAQQGIIWELVIVDDGSKQSPDSIIQTINDERIQYIKKDHAGKGVALNRGVKDARADMVCFLDQDDIMLPGRLKMQCRVLADNPESNVVYSDYERGIDNGDLIDQFISYQASNREFLRKMANGQSLISMQSLMIRKKTFFQIGGFSEDSSLTGLDDLEFFVRLFISGANLIYEPGIVQRWIQHKSNYSQSARFQEARLYLLAQLSVLAKTNRLLQNEMNHFRFHTYYMRGLYFLENNIAKKAKMEFLRAIRFKPLYWNSYYLLIKSLMLGYIHS
jgi:glycosyltransferase involved in cell wall biosynthesis